MRTFIISCTVFLVFGAITMQTYGQESTPPSVSAAYGSRTEVVQSSQYGKSSTAQYGKPATGYTTKLHGKFKTWNQQYADYSR